MKIDHLSGAMLKNVFFLAVCQALMLSTTAIMMSSSALTGLEIAPDEKLATLPLAITYIAILLALIPSSLIMQRYGRRVGFSIGAVCGIIGGITAGLGAYHKLFLVFCMAAVFQGLAMSFAQFYRFAAVEIVSEQYRSRAISWVLAGGLVAAFNGPAIARFTKDSFEGAPFSASYSSIAILCLGVLFCQAFLRFPENKVVRNDAPKRTLLTIIKLPTFIVAVFCAMIAYGSMNLLMISTPLAMHHLNMNFNDTAQVIQWHIVGMFAPSFFTGSLIRRFGVLGVMLAGAVVLLLCVAINFYGHDYWHFMLSLIALGVGWNFLYVGGTTLLTEVYRPSEKGIVQGVNDFMVFATVSITAMMSGYLHHILGWSRLNTLIIPVFFVVLVCIAGLSLHRKWSAVTVYHD